MYKQILAAAALFVGLAGGVQAAIVIDPTCKLSDVTTSTACLGRIIDPKNDQPDTILADESFFGINSWMRVQKSDEANNPLYNLVVTPNSGASSGTWSVSSFNGYLDAAIVVKASTNWAAYKLDTLFKSGTWSTAALQDGSGKFGPNISHISLYVANKCDPINGKPCDPPVNQVPVPASLPLLFGALGAVGIVARRRKRATA